MVENNEWKVLIIMSYDTFYQKKERKKFIQLEFTFFILASAP